MAHWLVFWLLRSMLSFYLSKLFLELHQELDWNQIMATCIKCIDTILQLYLT